MLDIHAAGLQAADAIVARLEARLCHLAAVLPRVRAFWRGGGPVREHCGDRPAPALPVGTSRDPGED